jgi:hypothetical protein
MHLTPRRGSTRIGPFRVNRSGLGVTSVTVGLGRFFRLVLWQRGRRR